jgi:hypothetical protein
LSWAQSAARARGAAGRGERVEPHVQGRVAGGDVAAGGEGFADEGAGLVAGAGVVPCRAGARMVSALQAAIRMAWVISLVSVSSRTCRGLCWLSGIFAGTGPGGGLRGLEPGAGRASCR